MTETPGSKVAGKREHATGEPAARGRITAPDAGVGERALPAAPMVSSAHISEVALVRFGGGVRPRSPTCDQ